MKSRNTWGLQLNPHFKDIVGTLTRTPSSSFLSRFDVKICAIIHGLFRSLIASHELNFCRLIGGRPSQRHTISLCVMTNSRCLIKLKKSLNFGSTMPVVPLCGLPLPSINQPSDRINVISNYSLHYSNYASSLIVCCNGSFKKTFHDAKTTAGA